MLSLHCHPTLGAPALLAETPLTIYGDCLARPLLNATFASELTESLYTTPALSAAWLHLHYGPTLDPGLLPLRSRANAATSLSLNFPPKCTVPVCTRDQGQVDLREMSVTDQVQGSWLYYCTHRPTSPTKLTDMTSITDRLHNIVQRKIFTLY